MNLFRYWCFGVIVCWRAGASALCAEEEKVRNPFQPSLTAPVQKQIQTAPDRPQNVILEGISVGPKGAFAVIGGEIYYEGEEKGSIKVTQIRKREVDTLINGAPETLSMIPTEKTMMTSKKEFVPADEAPAQGEPLDCDPVKGCV